MLLEVGNRIILNDLKLGKQDFRGLATAALDGTSTTNVCYNQQSYF